jgi:hypothetical protein
MVQFDDFLSVVNDAQLKSALNTYTEITQLMKRASDQRKRNAGEKLTVGIIIERKKKRTFIFFFRNQNTHNHQHFNLNHQQQVLMNQ